jgi:hypothetical protein
MVMDDFSSRIDSSNMFIFEANLNITKSLEANGLLVRRVRIRSYCDTSLISNHTGFYVVFISL